MSQQKTLETILQYPVVPVFYHADTDVCRQVLQACYRGGLRVFEFVNRGENALQTFKGLIGDARQNSGYILGAGTILTGGEAEDFIAAGADFIVSPCFIETVSDVCYQNKIPYMPGCMTIKEVYHAMDAGCEVIKIFPGEVVGLSFVKAVKAVFPAAKLMVTGGVAPSAESLKMWFGAGVAAVGMGSQLFRQEWLSNGKYAEIEQASSNCLIALKDF